MLKYGSNTYIIALFLMSAKGKGKTREQLDHISWERGAVKVGRGLTQLRLMGYLGTVKVPGGKFYYLNDDGLTAMDRTAIHHFNTTAPLGKRAPR
jgi:hypothetical protein